MKILPMTSGLPVKLAGSVLVAMTAMASASAATITKASTGTVLNDPTSWVENQVPGGNDIALFTSSFVTGNPTNSTLGGDLTIGQLALNISPSVDTQLTIDPGAATTLTLNGVNGIGLNNSSFQTPGNANKNATLQLGSGLTVNVAASQIWQVVNRGINVNGIITGSAGTTITKTGAGSLMLGANGTIINTFAGNLVMGGTTASTINSNWSSLSNFEVAGGTVTLNQNQSYTGYTGVNLINSSSALTLSGGNLAITGKTNTAVTQAFSGTTVAGGQSIVSFTNQAGTGSVAMDLGSITRNVGGLLLYNNTNTQAGTTVSLTSSGSAGMLKTASGVAYGTIGSGAATSWAARRRSSAPPTATATRPRVRPRWRIACRRRPT